MSNQFDRSLISNYVYGTLRAKDIAEAEALIGTAGKLQDFYEAKVEERDFLLQLIPDKKISGSTLKALKREISDTMTDIYPKEKRNISKSVADFLEAPVFTIKL